jgi:hypothetical protein
VPNLAQLGGDPGHRVGDTALAFRSVRRYCGRSGTGDRTRRTRSGAVPFLEATR